MSDRFGACSLALVFALLIGMSAPASAVNPVFTTVHGAACSVDRSFDPLADFNSDGAVDVADLLTFVVDGWPQ